MGELLHQFLDAHAEEWRDRIAIDVPPGRDRPGRITATYAQLAARSREIGRRLTITSPDTVVAVLLPRTTVDAFAAPIGIMRAGAAFTALDVTFPDDRIAEILRDSGAAAVVTDAAGQARLRTSGVVSDGWETAVVNCDDISAGPESTPAVSQTSETTPEVVAYLIYTSGTTGRPKGVMVEHAAIANLVRSDQVEFRLGPGDRVGQTSSHAYDSSIEEIWLALAAGATLVVLDDEVVRAGPDLIPWLERESITVLCPPPTLLRATGRRATEGLLPRLRLLYVGGEALTDDVVRVWAPGRRLVNGYGPTECAVTCIRTDVTAGQPVAIGRPIARVTACVLDASQAPVPDGEVGELWIGGAALARGYRNDPALTAARFVTHPALGRLYRTGDLARAAADGTLYCLGRVDTQVKIRGYRIELEEVEARLASLPGVLAAACRVSGAGGRQTLAAFVVPDTAHPPDTDDLRRQLRQTLPAYMVPHRIETIGAIPTTTGGKVDRAALPIARAEAGEEPGGTLPAGDLEVRIETAVRRILDRTTPISTTANFFLDLGGDSLLAAELITALRAFPDTAALTVRDAYEAPTVAELAARAATHGRAPAGEPRSRPEHGGWPSLVTVVQLAWLAFEILLAGASTFATVALVWLWLTPRATLVQVALVAPLIFIAAALLYLPASVAIAVAVKRAVIGLYAAGTHPVWGRFYLRHWIVCQSVRVVPWRSLEGTIFQIWALRALGARIGERVHLHRGVDLLQGGWDLLEIGDNAMIGQEAVVRLVDLDDEQVVVAPIRIGRDATIETRASVAGGASIGDAGYLTALSSLGPGGRVPANECWDGVPARSIGSAPETPGVTTPGRPLSPIVQSAFLLVTKVAGGIVTPAIAGVALAWIATSYGVTAADIEAWLAAPGWHAAAFVAPIAASLVAVPIVVVLLAAACRALGPIRAGVMDRWSAGYIRVWTKTDMVRRAGDWLSGTLMWPLWLRAAGMRVGPDCEISTIIDVVPELVEIGPSTFLADGVYLGGPRVHRGTVTLATTRLGSQVFLGNHVVIPAGAVVADGVLLGVSTVAHSGALEPGTAWFGHPQFAITRPPAAYIDPRLTHDPPAIRRLNRWLWEMGRFGLPAVPALIAVALWIVMAQWRAVALDWPTAFVMMPLFVVAAGLSGCAFVVALKWLLLGRVRPGQHALWSCWCSRWDFLYVAWGRIARPFLSRLDGTLALAWYLRAMGMRIGRRVVLGPGFAHVVDPDMIRIDDDVTVHALFQAHTFEDRLLKIDRIRIRRRATVGCGAVLFYGADIGEGASVSPQSVVMKHERLGPYQRYEGCPIHGVGSK